jgi:hypothetical protein
MRSPIFRLLLTSALALSSLSERSRAVDAPVTDDSAISSKVQTRPNPFAPTLACNEFSTVFLRFNLEDVLPTGTTSAQIAKATLRVWISNFYKHGRTIAVPVLQGWDEGSLDPRHLPRIAETGAYSIAEVQGAKKFVVFDITAMVQNWIDGAPSCGVALKGVALASTDGPVLPAASFKMDSKENSGTGHMPSLNITLKDIR